MPVRIGYNPDFAPFAACRNGRAEGLVVARLAGALDAAGLMGDFRPVPLPTMVARLLAGDVDALAGVAVAPARDGVLAFSGPLVMTGGAWFALADAAWPDDDGLRAAEPGRWRVVTPAAGPLAAPVRSRFPGLRLLTCTDYPEALQAVLDGRAEAAALNLQVGRHMAARDHPGRFALPDTPFFPVPLALAVPAGDPAGLLPRLDPHLG